ncbi:MAG TPA: TonB-dependent receptor [Gemmatimonadaceae bacterium]|nr:TonB-dependent receptor [Gemmatimonadaceae bacterium]
MRLRLVVLLVLATASVSRAQTQQSGRGAKLWGRVVDSATHAPLVGATVEISQTDFRQITDSAGRFVFVSPPSRAHVLRARHLGYLSVRENISVSPNDTLEHVVALSRIPVQLEELVISGKPVTFPRSFEEAYKRAARGRGVFFTREDIEDSNDNDYKPLLDRIPGVSANDRGVTFNRCQSGLIAASDPTARPKVQVYVDGHRMTLEAGDSRGIYAALSSVKPERIQIMEVYPNISWIPAEFLADACAVIVIWTKRD